MAGRFMLCCNSQRCSPLLVCFLGLLCIWCLGAKHILSDIGCMSGSLLWDSVNISIYFGRRVNFPRVQWEQTTVACSIVISGKYEFIGGIDS